MGEMLKVLLVEDSPGDARLLEEMLGSGGGLPCNVVHAAHLSDALSLLEAEPFDAVVLDLGLPDSSGMATVQRTREGAGGGRVPIIVVSGDGDSERARDAVQNGALDFLTKNGLAADELVRTLRFAVHRQHMRNRIEGADRLRQQFLANMSHELRTPLNSIIGYADMMRLGILGELQPEAYRGYVEDIKTSGINLLALIDDLLDLSKAENRMLALDEQAFDLVAVAKSVAAAVAVTAQVRQVQVGVTGDVGMVRLNGDERMIRQVLVSLVSNAVKFSPDEGRVDVAVDIDESGDARVVVRDSGIGMSREQLARVFEAYLQVDNAYRRSGEQGAGLGLALARHFVELHDGHIRLDSEPGHGTVATVTLPARRVLASGTA